MYYALPTAFSPAPYTFAVWAPIFLGCIAMTIYLCGPAMRDSSRLNLLRWLLVIAFLLTGLTAYTAIGWSNLVIVGLFITLGLAYNEVVVLAPKSPTGYWILRVPVAIFLSWCLVATVLNGCQFSASVGWPVGPNVSALLIGFASLIGLFFLIKFKEIAFALVLVWAFWGIVSARPEALPVVFAAIAGTSAMFVAAFVVYRKFQA